MTVRFDYYPEGKKKALTMSYDDGMEFDRKLIGIFNKYGIKGTFHLNSANFDREGYVTRAEIPALYANHEIASHMLTHPFPDRIPQIEVINETLEDRKRLEDACGYIVRGMSYPFGNSSTETISTLRSCGIEYSRTTGCGGFNIPDDFMHWNPTCHHSANIIDKLKDFSETRYAPLGLFYIWGHSFEFPRVDGAWEAMEEFCKRAQDNQDKIWFATNIQIHDYIVALKALKFSADRKTVYNPTSTDVWISVDDAPVKIGAGKTTKL